MGKNSFSIRSTHQYFSVDTESIRGQGGFDSPCLTIPIIFEFHTIRESYNERTQFELISFKAELNGTDKNFKLSETSVLCSYQIYDDTSYTINFNFQLNENLITYIEKYRKENLPMSISVQVQVGLYQYVNYTNKNGELVQRNFITSFDIGQGQNSFVIEQSMWVSKLLPQLGHDSYKLIELPLTNQIIPEDYKKSLTEFEEARKYFIKGDYDKTVAHCRAALDPFNGKTNLPKLKEFVKSKSELTWATTVLEATDEWLERIIKATSAFTSKTHHAPSIGHFDRTEADIVLMITTGIVAYIGKIEYKPE